MQSHSVEEALMKKIIMIAALGMTVACAAQKGNTPLGGLETGSEDESPVEQGPIEETDTEGPGAGEAEQGDEGDIDVGDGGCVDDGDEVIDEGDPRLAEVLRMDEAIVGGIGCAVDSYELALSTQAQNIELKTNAFQSAVSPEHRLDRKACTLAIPLKLPANLRLVVETAKLTGTARVTNKGLAVVNLAAFTGASQAEELRQVVETEGESAIELASTEAHVTACGAETLLRVNASSVLQSRGRDSTAELQVDGIVLGLKLETCDDAAP
jgi:hypothetical protein